MKRINRDAEIVNDLNDQIFTKHCLNYEESIRIVRTLLESLEDENETGSEQS